MDTNPAMIAAKSKQTELLLDAEGLRAMRDAHRVARGGGAARSAMDELRRAVAGAWSMAIWSDEPYLPRFAGGYPHSARHG